MDTLKSGAAKDWHPADVKAALEKRGLSLRKLAARHNYSHIQRVLYMKWLGAEKIVADALQMRPEQIWPSRYLEARDRAYALTRKVKVSRPKALPRAKAVK